MIGRSLESALDRFPLAARELSAAGRAKQTYSLRFVGVGLMLLGLGPGLLIRRIEGETGAESLAQFVTGLVFYYQFLVVLAMAPLVSSPLVAREKQERTLSLLLLADMSGMDVFLAKFAFAYLHTLLLLLSALPILAIAAFFGGVEVVEMTVQTLAFAVYAFYVVALGLLMSTRAARPQQAFVGTLIFSVLTLLLTSVIDRTLLVRYGFGIGLLDVLEQADANPLAGFFWAPMLAVTLGLGIGCGALAILLIPRQAVEGVYGKRREPRRQKSSAWFRMKPVERIILTGTGESGSWVNRTATRLALSVGLCLVVMMPCVGSTLIAAVIIYDVVAAMAATRGSGALDDLMTAPLSDSEIGTAMFLAFFKRGWMFVLPLMAASAFSVFSAITYGGFPFMFFDIAGLGPNWTPLAVALVVLMILLTLARAVFRLAYLTAVACCASTFIGSPARQTISGMFIVLLFSAVLLAASMVAMGGGMGLASVYARNPLTSILAMLAPVVIEMTAHLVLTLLFFYTFLGKVNSHLRYATPPALSVMRTGF